MRSFSLSFAATFLAVLMGCGREAASPIDAAAPDASSEPAPDQQDDATFLFPLGASCSGGGTCASGICADGVCCNSDCRPTCMACNLPASMGICTQVSAAADPDTCAGTKTCSEAGACGKSISETCSSAGECASRSCSDGVCCATGCSDEGKICTAEGLCKTEDGARCNADGECATGSCTTFYWDSDRDGYGDPTARSLFCGLLPPPDFVAVGTDCCDLDEEVHPGQTAYYGAPAGLCLLPWDYDCSGMGEMKIPSMARCDTTAARDCMNDAPGWQGVVPGCGETGTLVTACRVECCLPTSCMTNCCRAVVAPGAVQVCR